MLGGRNLRTANAKAAASDATLITSARDASEENCTRQTQDESNTKVRGKSIGRRQAAERSDLCSKPGRKTGGGRNPPGGQG